jgi:hypothetical protein
MARSWRCSVALHRYARTKSEDGKTTFLQCKDCGKNKEVPPAAVGTWTGN